MKKKQATTAFYNAFDQKLIEDYLYDNKRINKAIQFAIQAMPEDAKNILDIGCGIGWSSAEMARHNRLANVYGIDISPTLIDVASKLFSGQKKVVYQSGDFTQSDFSTIGKIDAFVFLDVFEHIHPDDRPQLIKFIKAKSNPEGASIILTCPTVKHQNWLAANKPEGLQPIDEKIDKKIVEHFAKELDGQVTYFQEQNIWNDQDYFHCHIQFGKIEKTTSRKSIAKLEGRWSRLKRVRRINKKIARDFLLQKLKIT